MISLELADYQLYESPCPFIWHSDGGIGMRLSFWLIVFMVAVPNAVCALSPSLDQVGVFFETAQLERCKVAGLYETVTAHV